MLVKKTNDKIEISFIYNPGLVSLVKTFVGRTYNPSRKTWFIPLANAGDAIDKLSRRGFKIDPALLEEVEQDKQKADEAEAMATMEDTVFETTLGHGKLKLYPFQRVVSAFMVKVGSCLNACGVRTGKTVMALAVTKKNKTKKNLVIVPGSIIYQWQSEIFLFLPGYKVFIAIGTPKERIKVYEKVKRCEDYFFLILSYDVARIDEKILTSL